MTGYCHDRHARTRPPLLSESAFLAGDSDGADEQVHSILLNGEDVFDARTHDGLERIGLPP